jgi:hypothetical protein
MMKLKHLTTGNGMTSFDITVGPSFSMKPFSCRNNNCRQTKPLLNFKGLSDANRFIYRPYCSKDCFDNAFPPSMNKVNICYKDKKVEVTSSKVIKANETIFSDLSSFILQGGIENLITNMDLIPTFGKFFPATGIWIASNDKSPIVYSCIESMSWLYWLKQQESDTSPNNCKFVKDNDDKLSLISTQEIKKGGELILSRCCTFADKDDATSRTQAGLFISRPAENSFYYEIDINNEHSFNEERQ